MAEALAILGVVLPLAQILAPQLNAWYGSRKEIPKVTGHIHSQLPLLIDVLNTIRAELDEGLFTDKEQKELLVPLNNCELEIHELQSLLDKATRKNAGALRALKWMFKWKVTYKNKIRDCLERI